MDDEEKKQENINIMTELLEREEPQRVAEILIFVMNYLSK